MLRLIGVGLDNGEITSKGIEAIKSAEKIYAEFYTNTETVDINRLEERTGKYIEKLSREEVEREDLILESAKEQDTAFLVSGDPITATTHYDIKHRAEQQEIDTEIIHAPSILTSVAETGLNVYKFGRVVTLPENSKPKSIIKHIEANDKIGLHTLVLLDINYEADKAAEKLVKMKEELGNREAVLFERANSKTQSITVGELEELEKNGETPHSIILVGEKSHKEAENLDAY